MEYASRPFHSHTPRRLPAVRRRNLSGAARERRLEEIQFRTGERLLR